MRPPKAASFTGGPPGAESREASGDSTGVRPLSPNERKRLGKRMSELEAKIADLEAKKTRLAEVMSAPDFFAQRERADAYVKQVQETERELEALYAKWETSAEHLAD